MKNIFIRPGAINVASHTGGYHSIGENELWELSPEKKFGQNKIYLIAKGKCTITINGTSYKGREGSFFFIPKGSLNSYKNDTRAPFSLYWTHFDIYPEENSPIAITNPITHIEATDSIRDMFIKYAAAIRGRGIADALMEKAMLTGIIAEYIRLSGQDKEISVIPDNDVINKLTYFIDANISEKITNQTLAKTAHMHPTHFIRFFKEKTGMTPQKYLKLKRLELAKHLIEESDLSISEIMNRVGYDDPSRFSKNFREEIGSSPIKFKKNIRLQGNLRK